MQASSRLHAGSVATRSWALILAGGAGTRLGSVDKAYVDLAGRPMIAHCMRRIRPQVANTLISANGDPARFRALACEVVPDRPDDIRQLGDGKPLGPLAGILAGLTHASAGGDRNRDRPHWLVTVPVDTPFCPADMVQRLVDAAEKSASEVAVAQSNGQNHWAAAVWHIELGARLSDWLRAKKPRNIRAFIQSVSRNGIPCSVEWASLGFDPFFNINTPEDLAQANTVIAAGASG